ncbi:hypothetical protein QYM36_003924, partial [Artemia franciscana]
VCCPDPREIPALNEPTSPFSPEIAQQIYTLPQFIQQQQFVQQHNRPFMQHFGQFQNPPFLEQGGGLIMNGQMIPQALNGGGFQPPFYQQQQVCCPDPSEIAALNEPAPPPFRPQFAQQIPTSPQFIQQQQIRPFTQQQNQPFVQQFGPVRNPPFLGQGGGLIQNGQIVPQVSNVGGGRPSFFQQQQVNQQQNAKPFGLPRECGISRFLSTRIVGGKESQPGSWPWMAALVYRLPDGALFFGCGGALVTNRHVITAAHCTSDGEDFLKYVRLGAHNLPHPGLREAFGTNNPYPENKTPFQQIEIEKKIIHPNYIRKKLSKNDIAILKLVRPAQFNDYVQPICIPWQENVRNKDLLGQKATIAGWGTTLFNRKEASPFLQDAPLPIADPEACKKAYSKIKTSIVFDETVLCAGDGSGKADSCQGDSGGPLMADFDGKYYLIGVVSSGYRCAEPGFYGVYMKTTHYLDWIFKTVNE